MKMFPRRKLLRWAAALSALPCAALLTGYLASYGTPLPAALKLPPPATVTLVDRHDRPFASIASGEARSQEPISLAEMGSRLPALAVALEDHRFFEHGGIDFLATGSAVVRNLCARRIVSGGSTITQQLIKLTSGRRTRSWWAKLYENLAALRLEREWDKRRILEEYLNRSHYGNRQVGPVAAARAYFNKAPIHLTLPEAIYLAGLPQAPSRFNPWRHGPAAAERYRRSVARLSRLHVISEEETNRAAAPPAIKPYRPPERLAPHFVDLLLESERWPAGPRVQTTLDLDLQMAVEQRLATQLAKLASRHVTQGAVVVLDARTGAVRAMAGSRDYWTAGGEYNGATALQNCGSTLKPFLYLRAIDKRLLTAASLLSDTQDAIRKEYLDYDPRNYDQRFLGPIRVREALANSLNVPAVLTLSRVGARQTFDFLRRECGLRFAESFDDYGAGFILGNAEVSLLDLAAAYTVFAGHDLAVAPRLFAASPIRHRYFASPDSVAIVGDILSDNEARQKSFGLGSPLAFADHRIPCKTGTSAGFRDAWTFGVTHEHVVGVWVGNFDGHPMDEIASIVGAAPLWREVVSYLLAHGDTSVPAPKESNTLRRREICSLTGLRPIAASQAVVNEWFLPGTEPVGDASRYLRKIDGETRMFLPPEYTQWCRSPYNYLRALSGDDSLRIVCPAPNATFLIDPQLPRTQQALQLIASGSSAAELTWSIDGKVVAPSTGGHFWLLEKGRHSVEVRSANDGAAAEFITVE
jgi:penicillin-binding protein 1C